MSALSCSSTLAEIQAAYDDNACYAEQGSASKAKIFITAKNAECRMQNAEFKLILHSAFFILH